MASSLARQLTQNASLNAALFKSATTRTNRKESYIFSAQEAAQHDPESIHGLAYNAFLQLQQVDPRLAEYEDKIFSDYAKNQDRTLLSPADNEKLNTDLDAFLRLLSSHLFLETTSRVLEWLVRHFRIHEFNVEGTMACFLPYHESSLFARILQILHLKSATNAIRWDFLTPLRKTGQTLPREILLQAMSRDSELLRFIVDMLPQAVEENSVHPTLTSFYTVTLLAFVKEQSAIDENHVAVLLPAFSRILSTESADTSLAAYMLHVSLARKTPLTTKALKTILLRMLRTYREKGNAANLITAVVAICARQEELDSLPKKAVSALADIRNIQSWLTETFSIVGCEQFLHALITSMVTDLDDERYVGILGAMFRSNNLPVVTAKHSCEAIARQLVAESVESLPSERAAVKELGSILQQRYPDVFASVMEDVGQERPAVFDSRKADGAALSLHDDFSGQSDEGSMILAAYSADGSTRAVGVRRIIDWLSIINYRSDPAVLEESSEIRSSLRAALLARVSDTDLNVLQALYSDSAKLLDSLPAEDLYLSLKQAASGEVSRKQLELHLSFASAFASRYPAYTEGIFFNVFLPHLLLTKAHHKGAISAWRIFTSSPVHELPLLRGLVGLIEPALNYEEEEDTTIERLAQLNQEIVTKLTKNVISSDSYKEYVRLFQDRLSDECLPTRLLALLIIKTLLSQLSGEHRLALANDAIDFLQSPPVSMLLQNEEMAKDLAVTIYTRSKSSQTLRQLHLALLLGLAEIERPINAKIDYMCDSGKVIEQDPRGAQYVTLLRKVYKLINSASLPPSVRSRALQRLFSSAEDSALLLLCGVSSDVIMPTDIRVIALCHARAFLRAQSSNGVLDYQVILPAILVALYDQERPIRAAAVDCLACMNESGQGDSKPTGVYAVDNAYGISSGDIQYLEWDDVIRYVHSLVGHSKEILLDRHQVVTLHRDALAKVKGEGKKTASFKDRLLVFLLSHVKAWRSLHPRVCLLEVLSSVQRPVKLEIILPLLTASVKAIATNDASLLCLVYSEVESALPLFVQAYDSTVADELNKPGSEAWDILVQCLRIPLNSAPSRALSSAIVTVLQTDLPRRLNRERQIELFEICLGLVVASEQNYSALKLRVSELLDDPSAMADLLEMFRPQDHAGQRPSKRFKQDDPLSSELPTQLSNLTLLAEIISSRSFPGTVALVSTLLETLGAVMNAPSAAGLDMDYTQQQLLAAISSTASQIDTDDAKTSATLRIDLIVDLVRSTANPQTSRQALLTIANLAPLSKDSVLHNVMPIFTFMGSSVFQNDDAYSFTVIQRTVDSVVPVMAASLREQGTTSLDLYLRSREFLRVFTDASLHIPRHRRVNFFLHLIEVLGPDEFLPPVCILLVDKVASRVVKQKAGDVPSSFTLPLACLNRRSPRDRCNVLIECLHECQRLRDRLEDPKSAHPVTFLDILPSSSDERAPTAPRVILTRQIQAQLLFVGVVVDLLRGSPLDDLSQLSEALQSALAQLLELSKDVYLPGGSKEIGSAALACIDRLMSVVSVPEYATTLQAMLQSTDETLLLAALSQLSRLSQVTVEARKSIATLTMGIIHDLVHLLTSSADSAVRLQALHGIELVVRNSTVEEEGVVAQEMSTIMAYADQAAAKEQVRVLSTVRIIAQKLGPRMIPSLRLIVGLCTSSIGGRQRAFDGTVCKTAFELLGSLVKALPNFMGTFVAHILEVILDPGLSLPDFLNAPRQALLRTIAKEVPSKSLLPTVYNVWSTMTAASAPSTKFMSMFFDMVQRALRSADRADVLDQLRPTFKFFLEAFDSRGKWFEDAVDEYFVGVEGVCISAFMQVVVKLNETSFKPLFRRLYDWGLEGQSLAVPRQVVFYRFMEALVDQLKSIITPYLSIFLDHTIEVLRQFHSGDIKAAELWINVVTVLRKSFEYDEGAFWRDNTMSKVMPALVDQIETCPELTTPPYISLSLVEPLSECLACMSQAASDDVAKALNLAVWMKSRSDSVDVRLAVLKVAQSIWKKDGTRLSTSGYGAETVAFLVECLEDSSEAVENEARAFQRQLTKLVGPLEGLI